VSPSSSLLLPSPEKSKKSDHTCPICKTHYTNIGNFKMHMKSHDNDHLREQRNQILTEIVSVCYSKRGVVKQLEPILRLLNLQWDPTDRVYLNFLMLGNRDAISFLREINSIFLNFRQHFLVDV
jgi:hypothetical protein